MTVMDDDRDWANVEGEVIVSTETDELKAMPSGSRPVLTQGSFVGELPKPVLKVVYHALV